MGKTPLQYWQGNELIEMFLAFTILVVEEWQSSSGKHIDFTRETAINIRGLHI
jgi:hypothetical protein